RGPRGERDGGVSLWHRPSTARHGPDGLRHRRRARLRPGVAQLRRAASRQPAVFLEAFLQGQRSPVAAARRGPADGWARPLQRPVGGHRHSGSVLLPLRRSALGPLRPARGRQHPGQHRRGAHRLPRHAITGRRGADGAVLVGRLGLVASETGGSSGGSRRMITNAPWLARVGDLLRQHAKAIRLIQWLVVGFYLILLLVPAVLSLPPSEARMLDNITVFAQFLFWGLWWPFVLLSMVFFGRLWCGVLCPEGSLSEWISWRGLNKGTPRWIRWSGWPTIAFILTTVYGQLISVYDYGRAAALILGGSTVAAMLVGFLYGRGKRVWCRHLCPVSGVFSLLARLAPVHYKVDEERWQANQGPHLPTPNCAPLIDIRRMQGNSDCHACGRCSGQRGAVALSARSPNQEILIAGNPPQH